MSFSVVNKKKQELYMDINVLIQKAKEGDSTAQNHLGVCYMEGTSIPRDEKKAAFWFANAAKSGMPEAIKNFGVCKILGEGVTKDLGGGLFCLESAYLLGVEDSLSFPLVAISEGRLDVLELVKLSATDDRAKWALGLCYDQGVGVEKDTEKSWNLYCEAYEHLNPIALYFVGAVCGKDETHDFFTARISFVKLLKAAEEQVGGLYNRTMLENIQMVEDRIKKDGHFLLLKVITECTNPNEDKDKYVQDFLDGKLFMKTLDQFSNLQKRDSSSKNSFRGDVLEGITSVFGKGYNPYLYSTVNGEIVHDGILGTLDILTLRKKVCCFAAIDYFLDSAKMWPVSDKMRQFGEYAVVIHDVGEFLNRVRVAFEKLCREDNAKYELSYDRVSYDVSVFGGEMHYSEFHKSPEYAWQNEFRISIDFTEGRFSNELLENVTDFAKLTFPDEIQIDKNPKSTAETVFFEIGDIRDICSVHIIDEIYSGKCGLSIMNVNRIEPLQTPHSCQHSFGKGITAFMTSENEYHLAVSRDAFFVISK